MMWLHKAIMLAVAVFVGFAAQAAHAGTPAADRVALEAGVRAEVMKDLAAPYRPTEGLSERSCLTDGQYEIFKGIWWSIGPTSNVRIAAFRSRFRPNGTIPACALWCATCRLANTANPSKKP